ncbi:MAG: formylglycine-generating enzyme family protein [Nitrosomonas sp.]|nr:formylglycine-generating enzyme family protein [Nitrosomonas sp.]
MVCVTWHDAQAYVTWLSNRTGLRYRLPTEAEWEYAARANSNTTRFYKDDRQCDYANGAGLETRSVTGYDFTIAECRDPYVYTAPVGRFKSNDFGLYDILGNVMEWTQDFWHNSYINAPTDGTAWLEKKWKVDEYRVVRGGSWKDSSQFLRSADRLRLDPEIALNNLGFRIARDF